MGRHLVLGECPPSVQRCSSLSLGAGVGSLEAMAVRRGWARWGVSRQQTGYQGQNEDDRPSACHPWRLAPAFPSGGRRVDLPGLAAPGDEVGCSTMGPYSLGCLSVETSGEERI